MKLKSYSLCQPSSGICKQWAIWGQDSKKNSVSPLIYLQRPKWIKDDDVWQQIVNSVRLNLPSNLEIK